MIFSFSDIFQPQAQAKKKKRKKKRASDSVCESFYGECKQIIYLEELCFVKCCFCFILAKRALSLKLSLSTASVFITKAEEGLET